jgi:hypothetical protein
MTYVTIIACLLLLALLAGCSSEQRMCSDAFTFMAHNAPSAGSRPADQAAAR